MLNCCYTHAKMLRSILMSVTYFEMHPQCKMDWWIDRGMTGGYIHDKTNIANVNCRM